MTFASSAFGQLQYMTEVTPGVTPNAGNGNNLRMTSPTAKAAVSTISSQEIRPDRLSTGLTRTGLDIDGGFNFELSGKEYDPFLEGVLDNTFTHHGVQGLGAVFSMSSTALTIVAAVAPVGASAFTTLPDGSWFKVIPPVAASAAVKEYFADKWLKVDSTDADEITLDPSTPLSGVGVLGAPVAGYRISASRVQNGAGLNRTFTLQYGMTDIAQFLAFRGMRANTMELTLDTAAMVTGSFGFIGMGHDGMKQASTLPGTAAASHSLEVMNSVADLGAIYEGGQSIFSGTDSFIKSAKFSISNNMRGQKALGVYGNAGVGLGELAITGTLEVYLEDATYYNKWFRGESTDLALGLADSAGNGYMLEFDKIQFTDGGVNPGGRNDDVMLSLPFQAFYSAETGRGMRVTRAIAA